jgi:hypothetical protein
MIPIVGADRGWWMRVGAAVVVVALCTGNGAWAKTPLEEAKEHFINGTKLFNLTRYDDAIREYEAAYEIKDDPVFLYNIAQAHRLAGHLEKAIRFYRNYLRQAPDSPKRAEIEQRIVDMEKALETQHNQQAVPPIGVMQPGQPGSEAAPERKSLYPGTLPAEEAARQPANVPSPSVAPAEQPVRRVVVGSEPAVPIGPTSEHRLNKTMMKWSGLGLLAAGAVVAVAGGIGFGVAADSKANAIADEAASGTRFDPSLDSARTTFQAMSIASYVLGGAMAVAGTTLLILGTRHHGLPQHASLQVAPVVGGRTAGLSFAGGF